MAFTPNAKSIHYQNNVDKWTKVQTLLNGEDGIKAAGELYLPKPVPKEGNQIAEARFRYELQN